MQSFFPRAEDKDRRLDGRQLVAPGSNRFWKGLLKKKSQEEAGALEAKAILAGFLAAHDDVFRMGTAQLAAGLPVLESRTQAHFDANWNVIAITRTLYTPALESAGTYLGEAG